LFIIDDILLRLTAPLRASKAKTPLLQVYSEKSVIGQRPDVFATRGIESACEVLMRRSSRSSDDRNMRCAAGRERHRC
jgi:hypothetical protein